MDEQVDIIDEKGTKIQVVSKKRAHEEGLLHKTVIGELISSKGQWCMVKQASDRQDPGQFVSPVGGHVIASETTDHAIRREAEEELGITRAKFKHIGNLIFNRKVLKRQENHMFVLYEMYSDEDITLNEESDSFRWFEKSELKQLIKNKPKMFGGAFFPILNAFYPELL